MTPPASPPEKSKDSTPLMRQYEEIKARHPGEILLFRLGDFYEMFGEDARRASPVLEVALTQRQGVPMCGIPFHAMERYVAKLLKKGIRVAVADQLEDPSAAKGIVRRDVTRTISAGTVIEENLLKEKSNNFLLALSWDGAARAGLAMLDISTGQFFLGEIETGKDGSNLASEICRIQPSEILIPESLKNLDAALGEAPRQIFPEAEARALLNKALPEPADPGPALPWAGLAAKMVYAYLEKMNPAFLANIQAPVLLSQDSAMTLDRETIENLELVRNSHDGTSERTLLSFLDRTLTSMGGRMLKQWLLRPLVNLEGIEARLQAVEYLLQDADKRRACREELKGVSDLERIAARVLAGHAGPRDVLGLKNSLERAGRLRALLARPTHPDWPDAPPLQLRDILSRLEDWTGLSAAIAQAIADNPPLQLDNGGVIRAGFDADLDEKRQAGEQGKTWLQELEAREREGTRIPTLKIGYTSVFGYYFEVTKPHLPKVPPHWHRKQTLLNNERFVNQELKQLEEKILGAEEQALRIERAIFQKLLEAVKAESRGIQRSAGALAELDCFLALAEVAELKSLAKPRLDLSERLWISQGWHPVVKESIPSGLFVANDADLNGADSRILILTGPNMSGKSTYLRQTALIALMAQIGSFVPAQEVRMGVLDRIFTRIGSGDRLAQGESTFMVEMSETARILQRATSKSLIILDEVGRGTSTYDGISIAWSVIEHLAKEMRPKVLFATHYFELTHLAGQIEGIKNFNVQAKEWNDSVLFLHKIVPGPADRSYGIHVAQLAGLPAPVIEKAKKILEKLEREHYSMLKSGRSAQQLSFTLGEAEE